MKRYFRIAKRVLVTVLAITIVLASAPVSVLAAKAAKAPVLSGVPGLTYIKYNQSDKTKAKTATIKVKNINTKTQSVTWSTTNKNIVRITKKTANSASVTIYYKKGSATLKAVVRNKKTKKVVKKLKRKFTVYQGATGVDVGDSKGTSIKNKTVSIGLEDTYTLSKKSLPSGKVNEPTQKTPVWLQTNDSKAVGIMSGNTFEPVQENVIGRGAKNATVTATVKGSSVYESNTTITVNGGMFTVSNIDSKDATLEVGVNINADITLLKGTEMTLTGIKGTETEGKTLTAKYTGSTGNKAVFRIDQKENMEKGGYNGVYQISFVDGAKFVNDNNQVSYYADKSNEIKLSSNANVKKVTVSGDAVVPVSVEQENTTSWTVVLPYGSAYSSLLAKNIKVELEDQYATMGAITTANEGQSYTFTVTAQDKTTVNYVINVCIAPSSDAGVKAISVSNSAVGVIQAVQEAGTTKWNVTLPFGTSLSSILAMDFSVELNDNAATHGVLIATNDDQIYNFTVIAEDGTAVTYSIHVTIAPSNDASVKEVKVYNVQYNKYFYAVQESETEWSIELPYGIKLMVNYYIYVATSDNKAMVNDIVISEDGETCTFRVVAEDGTTEDYTITVSNAPKSNNANIARFIVYDAKYNAYDAVKESETTWVLELPEGISLDSMEACGLAIVGEDAQFSVRVTYLGTKDAWYTMVVTSHDGTTIKEYTLIIREAN